MIKTKNGEYWTVDKDGETPDHVKACRPGGGWVCRIPKQDVIDWDAHYPEDQYRLVPVAMCDDETPICYAYVGMERWNGWARPLADRENVLKFLGHQEKLKAESGPCEGLTTGTFVGNILVIDHGDYGPNEPKETSRIEPETILYKGQNVEVWDIQLGLIWDECIHPESAEAILYNLMDDRSHGDESTAKAASDLRDKMIKAGLDMYRVMTGDEREAMEFDLEANANVLRAELDAQCADTTIVSIQCPDCRKTQDIKVGTEALARFRNGAHVQAAFPELSKELREAFITGTCPACWLKMFPPPPTDTQIIERLIEEFPGLLNDEDVNGGDLVEYLSEQLAMRKEDQRQPS